MDSQYGGIQWIQHHSSSVHSHMGGGGVSGDMKTAGQLIIDPHPPREEDLMASSANSSSDYMGTEDEEPDTTTASIDLLAAENLILMARDGHVVTGIIGNRSMDKHGAVVVTASDGEQIDCDDIMRQAALIQQHEDAGGGVYIGTGSVEQYDDTTPQMVTEEVITDDWVQHQGEERVEISADQIIGSSSQVLLDIEVPLPTVQDEYTALRPYPCDFCSRRFRKKASLMNHMVAHQNDRPHLCRLCGSRFVRRSDLINHLKAHAEDSNDPEPASQIVDDSDFINFVTDTAANTSNCQRTTSDSYYELILPEDSVTIPTRSSRKIIQQQQQYQQQQTTSSMESQLQEEEQQQQQQQQQHTSSTFDTINTTTNSYTTNSIISNANSEAQPTAPPRGRISRLKPKEDSYAMDDMQSARTSNAVNSLASSSFNIIECDTLSASNATVKLTQDSQPASTTVQEHSRELHFPIIDDSKPFVCQQCGLAFAREKAMLSHSKTHRNDSPFECPQCNELFWDQNSLQDHQKTHQFEDSNSEYDPNEGEEDDTQSESESEQKLYGEFYCSECGMSFHRQDILKRHLKSHAKANGSAARSLSNGNSNETAAAGRNSSRSSLLEQSKDQHCCNTCGETFAEALDLLAHAEIHARYPPFKCVLCGESFFEEPTIKRHLQSQHANDMTENSCILCGKECRDRKALIKHAWDHSREKCHSCSKCGKNFHNKARLKRHMASHRDKSVQCDVCHEEFPDGRTLSNHRHSHSTTSAGKLFPCLECGKTFGSRSSQQIHVRIHTGERPYGCRFCWKAFADGGTLRKHERIHTGEKPYACSVCPRAFNQRVVLREHIRSHHSGLDTKMGTYYCTVCTAHLTSSTDLIQHLIQHSDNNTAMQRQPVTGPRKYKRRRKLKPHEIARLKRECKQNGGNASDLDLSDFDMDTVDDLLAMTESNSASNDQNHSSESKISLKHNNVETMPNQQHNNNNGKITSTSSKRKGKIHQRHIHNDIDEDFELDVGTTVHKKTRYASESSDKLWPTKMSNTQANEEAYKSLLSNLETTLQSIDTLVVGPSKSSNSFNSDTATTKHKVKQESLTQTLQRTQQVQIVTKNGNNIDDVSPSCSSTATSTHRGRKSKAEKLTAQKQTKGPQMIHTEKYTATNGAGDAAGFSSAGSSSRRKSKLSHMKTTYTTITNLANILPTQSSCSSSAIVDDYDIITPAPQPPKQISSSPLHIKQEQDNHHQQQQQHRHNLQLRQNKQTYNKTTRLHNNNNAPNPNDLYDAHLLLEASGLRNDLDEILRSPLKSDLKSSCRQRFTSESSTQFLAEQSEEEQHLIKIEPTSPDLREIVNGVSSSSVSHHHAGHSAEATATMGLVVVSSQATTSSNGRRSNKSTRTQRNLSSNRKYLEFTADLNDMDREIVSARAGVDVEAAQDIVIVDQNIVKTTSQKRNSLNSKSFVSRSSAARCEPPLSNKMLKSTASSYLDYDIVDTFSNVVTSSSADHHHHHHHHDHHSQHQHNSFASISAVVSAADASAAAAAAAAQQKPLPTRKQQRYFECEMCSAVFSDRAQLLDHVPIHI